jgi:hypothetical protein
MKRKLTVGLIFTVLMTLGCIGQPTKEEVVPLADVIKDPLKYKEQRIGVSGYLHPDNWKTFCRNRFWGVSCNEEKTYALSPTSDYNETLIVKGRELRGFYSSPGGVFWGTIYVKLVGEIRVSKNVFGENFFYFDVIEGERVY